MPDDPVEACLVQHRLIRGLGPVIVAEMHRATGGEHRHIDGRPLVQGTSDRHAGAVVRAVTKNCSMGRESRWRESCASLPYDFIGWVGLPMETISKPCCLSMLRKTNNRIRLYMIKDPESGNNIILTFHRLDEGLRGGEKTGSL
jgi:hypothetical protein